MREVAAELKALRLHGMAGAWDESWPRERELPSSPPAG